jgi:hypothetical protein
MDSNNRFTAFTQVNASVSLESFSTRALTMGKQKKRTSATWMPFNHILFGPQVSHAGHVSISSVSSAFSEIFHATTSLRLSKSGHTNHIVQAEPSQAFSSRHQS